MPDRNEIENGVHHCAEIRDCRGCPYQKYDDCSSALISGLMAYIRKQEAKRDRLKEENQNLLKKVPVWKRVEDEKPPYNTQVKIWTNEGFEYIGVYTYSKEFITDGFIELTHKATHWMHLDEAPTAGASPRPTETREGEA